MLFPTHRPGDEPRLTLELDLQPDSRGDMLPRILWAGVAASDQVGPSGYPSTFRGPGVPLLGEHAHELFTRPHLRGHRVGGADAAWSTRFLVRDVDAQDSRLVVTADDDAAGLRLTT